MFLYVYNDFVDCCLINWSIFVQGGIICRACLCMYHECFIIQNIKEILWLSHILRAVNALLIENVFEMRFTVGSE